MREAIKGDSKKEMWEIRGKRKARREKTKMEEAEDIDKRKNIKPEKTEKSSNEKK